MYYTIYKVTNNKTGMYYIGKHQTKDLNDDYTGSGLLIRRAIQTHGIANFTKEILHIFTTEEEMNLKERELVVISEESYNLCPGGKGGFGYINTLNLPRNEYGKKGASSSLKSLKWKEAIKNKPKLTEETKLKISITITKKIKSGEIIGFTGKTHSSEWKNNHSEIMKNKSKGIRNSQYGTCWITNGEINKKIKISDFIPYGFRKGRIIK